MGGVSLAVSVILQLKQMKKIIANYLVGVVGGCDAGSSCFVPSALPTLSFLATEGLSAIASRTVPDTTT